ncbi:ComF family protein [Arcticibacter sp. MXS-1]|uniref:ComF family protein n=1 Tax=Arcticibacter sp. MXS-1 TaxID=3341726 RepID=UPI0035A8ECF5
MVKNETVVCTSCLFELPATRFHYDPENSLIRQFYGRFPFVFAIACFYYSEGSKVQRLIHKLKYKGKPEVGLWIGRWYGHQVADFIRKQKVDFIIPVPLHRDRLKKRGYNQSERIAAGLAQSLDCTVLTDCLIREIPTETQTRKSRQLRLDNMEHVFGLRQPERIAGRHILLVDDVVTSGATLEACALCLSAVPGVKVSVLAAAYTV